MAKASKKNLKTLAFDPFADLDSQMVQDVLGRRSAESSESPQKEQLAASPEPELIAEPVESIPPLPEPTGEEISEVFGVAESPLAEPGNELVEQPSPLLELLISNLDVDNPADIWSELVAEHGEDALAEPEDQFESSFSVQLSKLALPEEPELAEMPFILDEFIKDELAEPEDQFDREFSTDLLKLALPEEPEPAETPFVSQQLVEEELAEPEDQFESTFSAQLSQLALPEEPEPADALFVFQQHVEHERAELVDQFDSTFSTELLELDSPEEPVPAELPFIFEQPGVQELKQLLKAPVTTPTEEQDSLEDILRQIDDEFYQPDHTGDVFGLTRTAAPDAATLKRHVVFSVGNTEFAVPILTVSEVVRPLKITPVPNVPDWVLGVANLRGDIISVVDLRIFFGQATPESLPLNRMLVVHSQNEEVTTGLIVDRASGIFDLPQEQIRSPSAPIDDKVSPFMQGVSEVNDRLLVVLDLNQLLVSAEMQQFQ
jgi:purine-binding chemotaxis protein CheW